MPPALVRLEASAVILLLAVVAATTSRTTAGEVSIMAHERASSPDRLRKSAVSAPQAGCRHAAGSSRKHRRVYSRLGKIEPARWENNS